eukprot:1154650-Pelagomonas_calceolata.AAC.1
MPAGTHVLPGLETSTAPSVRRCAASVGREGRSAPRGPGSPSMAALQTLDGIGCKREWLECNAGRLEEVLACELELEEVLACELELQEVLA